MGYDVQQHEAVFAITKGKEAEALAACLKADLGLFESDDLTRAFDEYGWAWVASKDETEDELYRDNSRHGSDTGLFLDTIAPFVVDGSYITLIGEDLCIWRYYFKGGKCEEQYGDITFTEGTPVPAKPSTANKRPPGIEEGEVFIDTVGGEKVVFPSAEEEPDGASYIRIVDERGVELVLWHSEEWKEAPEEVMGALMGAMMGGSGWNRVTKD